MRASWQAKRMRSRSEAIRILACRGFIPLLDAAASRQRPMEPTQEDSAAEKSVESSAAWAASATSCDAIAAADFGGGPVALAVGACEGGVADVVERGHDAVPAGVAVAEFDIKALPEPLGVALLAREVLYVELEDAAAEDADPLLGPAGV